VKKFAAPFWQKIREDKAMNPTFKCTNCGYTLEAPTPPEECPSCREKCEFVDVTCYIPECGTGPKDERLG